jgi:hypothetical protein
MPRDFFYNAFMRPAAVLAMLMLGSAAAAVHAVDNIVFTAARIESPSLRADKVRIALTPGAGATAVELNSPRIVFAGALGEHRDVHLVCANARLDAPAPGCASARVTTSAGPLGALQLATRLSYHIERGELSSSGSDWRLAEGAADFRATLDARRWQAQLRSRGMKAAPLRAVLQPYATLPKDVETEGEFDFDVALEGADGAADARWELKASKVNFTNPDGSLVGEKLAFVLSGTLTWPRNQTTVLQTTAASAAAGQALLGPVLFDFAKNPLELTGQGDYTGSEFRFRDLKVAQQDLLNASGPLSIRLEPDFAIASARFDVSRLQFPAAYVSLLQLATAATVFGDLETSGNARGTVEVSNNAAVALDLDLTGLDLKDRKDKFRMQGIEGQLRWRAPGAGEPPDSWLAWREGGSYGLQGGAARIDFRVQGSDFKLTKPTRIPIFDGALRIRTLAISKVGADDMQGEFEGDIEPIGMPRIAQAFGWPELAGTLGGRIPRVEYRDKVVNFSGDVVAQVFDGRIVGSRMRLQDPLGPWPRFFADVKLENLDLAMVTDTFSIGSITGRLEGQVADLELFNWSPVKFDALLQTPPRDASRHRISAKAVATLSDIGNSGRVAARLQSNVLRYFDEYDYARIGIRCRLNNEVCAMSGIEPTGIGYTILQGKGLPRINIVGNAGLVNWPTLVTQIGEAMRDTGKIQVGKPK